ncbi:Hsp70 family protein [Myroides marinus]|uniref:Hsp70 family protein n=1 Tax=Flavobacteriales TaxID=200644 RepID=UPI000BFCB396|nr:MULTISPECIES: Hsp70 family protein [Flavobacteriales]ATN06651.1 heat-shock protein Hsp70 [Chryseobacterium indologenes]MDM1347402.1 Hsp70 family protein [Myroides marinus]MDM1353729.1 Hsp70 family protein [Myroides marinus]MDM1364637.1 Hsp70 family protein [Myroides marinus]MDM1370841.1 Hsp70 family protein [Myroides marinus]
MRNKIDYGIDLGTTNSAIARMENGIPTIKKSDTLKDTVPSCVHFNKRQDILVGDTAFNVMKNDNTRALKTFEKGKTNTFIEFKRTMGTTHTYECSNMKKDFSSEELSSEVLKKLKSFIQDENISSIVITVPAKFLNPQNEATMQAAKLAGFQHIQLLQEPVAAATAYGLDAKAKDGYWLVFDLGGGTFDAALVKSEEGILSVKDTDGDNWLGGKNLDEAIVDQIIIPNLQENYSIDSVLEDVTKREILRNAVKPFAEEAKIQLSFKDSHNVLSNLGDLPFEDDNGEEPEIDVEVSQKDMESVLAPIFQKAIDITKELLKRNNLKGSDLGALILVGGPTYSPILRRMLKEQITDNVDTSVDPMTVVARGAALFASTISVSDEVKEATRDKTKLQLEINYEATSVELDEMINLKVLKDKTEGLIPDKIYADVVRGDGAWSSGKKLIGEKATILDVLLVEGKSNAFGINVYDETGNKLDCQPNQFTIIQGIGGLDKMQVLPYHIGIGKWFETEQKDLFQPAKGLEKNKQIGKGIVGVIDNLYTRSDIRAGMRTDIIRIPIYQGDYNAEGTNPLLNNFVNEVVITGETLPKVLPKGSPVNITIRVDGSSLMKFSAEFPTIEHIEELEVEIKNTEAPEEAFLTKEISKAKRTAQKVNADDVSQKLETLEEQLENEKGSADGKMKILDGLRKELLKLDGAEKATEWPKVEQDLKDAFYELEDLIEKIRHNSDDGDLNLESVNTHIQEYRTKIEYIIKEKNAKDAKELTREIGQLDFELRNAVTGNAMDVQFLRHLNDSFGTYHWKDTTKARQLLNQGLQMATNGRTSGIRQILVELISLMPENEKPKETLG